MTKLKILIAIMVILLVFILWYSKGQAGEEHYLEPIQVEPLLDEPTEEEILIQKVNGLVGNESISTTIVKECMSQTEDYKLCIKNVIWVASAESSIFKKGMYPSNNWFGRMYKWKKRRFNSVEESIKLRIEMYVRNGWDKRTNGQARLRGKYCASACSHWVGNYSSAIYKLGLD